MNTHLQQEKQVLQALTSLKQAEESLVATRLVLESLLPVCQLLDIPGCVVDHRESEAFTPSREER